MLPLSGTAGALAVFLRGGAGGGGGGFPKVLVHLDALCCLRQTVQKLPKRALMWRHCVLLNQG